MNNILTISKREITRLRSRFTGRSRLFVIGIFLVAVVLSYVIYHQEPVISKALYSVGVSQGSPVIADERFHVIPVDSYSIGNAMLRDKDIDIFIFGDEIIPRDDDRSKYAAGAIKEYLERQELLRMKDQYDIDQAFPLRIEVRHLARGTESEPRSDSDPSLSEIINSDDIPDFTEPALQLEEPIMVEPTPPKIPEPAASYSPDPDPSEIEHPVPAEPVSGSSPESTIAFSSNEPEVSATDSAVLEQLEDFENDNGLPEFKAEFAADEEIIIPSLLKPPIPVSQVLLAFFYIVPIFFVSIFFTSSFMEEKTNRKLIILLSAPITPFQIIMGKMLPYFGYSIITIILITLALGGNVLLALAIFIPIMLFIFSIYLMVALLYRTFKDQTFFSMMAVWIVTAYLVAPAMFTGVNDLSFISPLTMAVLMYRGESFGLDQYFLSTIPMYVVFFATVLVGTRIFNEEYLMGFRPLYRKLSEAIYFIIDKKHLSLSVIFISLIFIPVAFMIQSASIVIAHKLSLATALGIILALSVVTEEIVKSSSVTVLLQNKMVTSYKSTIKYSFMAGLGFLIGEKLLLFLTLRVVSESVFTEAVFSSGVFLIFPLIMHFVTTSTVCLITARLGLKFYPLGIIVGSLIHAGYNLFVVREAIF